MTAPMPDRSEFDETRSRRRNQAAVAAATTALAGELEAHPTYDDLAAVVDRSADDVTLEIVTSHVEVCAECAAELADLRAFAGRGGRSFWRPVWFAGAAAAVVVLILVGIITRVPESAKRPRPVVTIDEWQRLATAALKSGRVDVPDDIQALAAGDIYRGNGQETAGRVVVSPAASVIDDLQPRFRWTGTQADTYEVQVYEDGKLIVRSEGQSDTVWVSPQPLARGKTYRWQVIARRGGQSLIIPTPPAPPAIFRVLGEKEHDQLARAAARHSGDDLVLGVLYARFGLLDQAREHLRKAGATNLASSLDFSR